VLFAGENGMLIHSDKLTYHKGREGERMRMVLLMIVLMIIVIVMMM
jgi:hypothetical protein